MMESNEKYHDGDLYDDTNTGMDPETFFMTKLWPIIKLAWNLFVGVTCLRIVWHVWMVW